MSFHYKIMCVHADYLRQRCLQVGPVHSYKDHSEMIEICLKYRLRDDDSHTITTSARPAYSLPRSLRDCCLSWQYSLTRGRPCAGCCCQGILHLVKQGKSLHHQDSLHIVEDHDNLLASRTSCLEFIGRTAPSPVALSLSLMLPQLSFRVLFAFLAVLVEGPLLTVLQCPETMSSDILLLCLLFTR